MCFQRWRIVSTLFGYPSDHPGEQRSTRMWFINITIVLSGLFLVLIYEASMVYVRSFIHLFASAQHPRTDEFIHLCRQLHRILTLPFF